MLLLGTMGLVALFLFPMFGLSGPQVARHWLAAAHGPWGLPVALVVFAVLAFAGVPQIALIATAVAVFGPWYGALYSWIATLASALVGFGLGRVFGIRLVKGLASPRLDRFTAQLARNGFLASLIVRLVPFAPFVVVNVVAGAARISLADFTLGTALGILPKIALTALAGGAVLNLLRLARDL